MQVVELVPNESVWLTLADGRRVLITYLGPRRNYQDSYALGVTAPKDVIVDREEVAARRAAARKAD